MRRYIPGLLACLLASPLAAAEKKPLTVEDIWAIQRVGSPVVSPDGKTAVFPVTTYDMEADRSNADLWAVPVAGGPARHLTTNKASDSSPAWSPDGKRVRLEARRRQGRPALRDAGGRRGAGAADRHAALGVEPEVV